MISLELIVLIAIIAFLQLHFSFFLGILNGLQRFKIQAFLQSLNPFLKFVTVYYLLSAGYGINGALLSMVVGFILAIGIGYYMTTDIFSKTEKKVSEPGVKKYARTVFLFTIIPSFLITIGAFFNIASRKLHGLGQ